MFYRIDGVADGHFGGLSGPRFFALAMRLVAYRGAVTVGYLKQVEREQEQVEEQHDPVTDPSIEWAIEYHKVKR